jgi:hypothetical protein
LIGANNLGASYLTDLASYLDARRAAGWHVILCTVLPQTSSVFNTARVTVNPELRLWTTNGSTVPGKHADRICDFAADPTIGDDADGANTTYYGDGIHPTAAGHAIMRKIFQPVLDAAQRNPADTVGPTITSAATGSSVAGTAFASPLTANESCTWTVSGTGFSITTFDTLNHASTTVGTYPCTITARDGSGNVTNQSFSLSVVAPTASVTWVPKYAPATQVIGFASATATFASATVNNASTSDVIVVAFTKSGGGAVTGVTIGGNAMTSVVSVTDGALSIWQYTGTVFTTPTIAATTTTAMQEGGVLVGYLTGVNPTAVDTEVLNVGFSGIPITTPNALTVPATGYGIAVMVHVEPPKTIEWLNGTENYEVIGTNFVHSMGYLTVTQKPSFTMGGSFGTCGIVSASWGP